MQYQRYCHRTVVEGIRALQGVHRDRSAVGAVGGAAGGQRVGYVGWGVAVVGVGWGGVCCGRMDTDEEDWMNVIQQGTQPVGWPFDTHITCLACACVFMIERGDTYQIEQEAPHAGRRVVTVVCPFCTQLVRELEPL